MRVLIVALLFLLPLSAHAQDKDSFFDDYGAYAEFVDTRIMTREFIELIQVLGGRDEYSQEDLNGIQSRFRGLYQQDFTKSAVIRETDLGNGFRQEARVYWAEPGGYLFFYALLHDRADATVVVVFRMNSNVSEILKEF